MAYTIASAEFRNAQLDDFVTHGKRAVLGRLINDDRCRDHVVAGMIIDVAAQPDRLADGGMTFEPALRLLRKHRRRKRYRQNSDQNDAMYRCPVHCRPY